MDKNDSHSVVTTAVETPPPVEPTEAPAGGAIRSRRGTFVPGVSGNPAGRPKGSKNKITEMRLLLEEQLRGRMKDVGPAIMEKAIEMALDGNDKIMRVLLDKMLSTPKHDDSESGKDSEVKVVIQNLTTDGHKTRVQARQGHGHPVTVDVADEPTSS